MKTTALILRALLLVSPALALAYTNVAMLRAGWDLDRLGTSRRYWEDLTVAYSLYETRDWGPTPSVPIGDAMAGRINDRLHELVPRAAQRAQLLPWQFWRTVEFRGFRNLAPFELRFSDDTGRARLSALGFRMLGGIAPYLPLWLPFLAFAPLAFWIMCESLRGGVALAGGLFLLLLSSSAYFLEALTLPYSAVGFHLVAALGIVPLSFFAFGPAPTRRGLWLRVLAAAALVHLSTWARSSSIIFLPFAAALLLLALYRVEAAASRRRRTLMALLMFSVLIAPRALAPRQAHALWIGVWEGLGDVDRQYGHEWSDPAARVALDREGYIMAKRGPNWTEETEAIFRRLVLNDLKADPVWYVKILLNRVVANVVQWRLWPKARETGLSYVPARHVAEGFVETYYNFVTTADGFTFVGRRWEAPLWLFWAAGLGFLFSARRPSARPLRWRLAAAAAFFLSAMSMPVAVTTLSGIEMQVAILGYLLALSFLASDLLLWLRARLVDRFNRTPSGRSSALFHLGGGQATPRPA